MSVIDSVAKQATSLGGLIKSPFGLSDRALPPNAGFRADDFKGGFVITPIRDGKEVPDARFALLGNMMPMTPFTWGGELRSTAEYYPGNPEPVVQVLGTQETDLVIRGRLKAKRYKDEGLRTVPYEVANLLESLRLRADLVQMRMGDWKRYGFIKRTKFDMKNMADIEYELTFIIVGFYLPKFAQVLDESRRIPFDLNSKLIADAQALQGNFSVVPTEMPTSIADVFNAAINDVAEAISTVTSFIDDVVTTAENVAATYNRALGTVRYAMVSLQIFRRRVSSLVSNAAITSSSTFSLATKYRLAGHLSSAVSTSLSLTITLEQMRARFADLARTIPMVRHRVQDGDTLHKLSMKYYGTAGEWKRIYDHNRLTSTVLSSGAVLEIPKL